MPRSLISFAIALALTACTVDSRLPGLDGSVDGSGDASARVDAGSDAAQPDTGPPVDGGPPLDDVLIYAHSRDTLYSFSPYSNTVTEVGVFQTASGEAAPYMLDLAVDSDGAIFASSDDRLWRVDPETAVATEVGDFGLGTEQLFALTFLTATESPDRAEMLLGATNEGAYYEVDPATAATDLLGSYPEGWSSSGDLVSVEGLGTFATVRRDDYPGDVLARILFAADGSSTVTVVGAVRNGTEDFRQIFGLGYWGRDLYGFSNSGQLIRINRETGAAEVVSTSTGASQFWGAGVTTVVPVLI